MLRRILVCSVLFCLMGSSAKLACQTKVAASPSAAAAATTSTASSTAVAAAPSADPKTPEEFFARARQLSDLEAAGIPFHLKATYVASGDAEFTGNGTYEEWWQSKDLWRTEATLGDYKYVVIKDGATTKAYATGPYLPLRLRQAMDAVLVRLPDDAGTTHKWKIQNTKLEGSDFAVLFKPDSCEGFEVACFQSYFTTDGMFRGRALNGRIQVLYNNLQPFQNLQIARSVTKEIDGTPILKLSITSIEPLGASATILSQDKSAPENLVELPVVPFVARIDSDVSTPQSKAEIRAERVTHPWVVHRVDAKYPDLESERRRSGRVAVACTIDANGTVREPYAQASAGAAFDQAAIEAVGQYRFKPATKYGKPILVDLIILIDFHGY